MAEQPNETNHQKENIASQGSIMKIREKLCQYGFQQVGLWKLDEKQKSVEIMSHLPGIDFKIPEQEDKDQKEITYIFLFEEEIGYIGSTKQCLKERLSQYRRGFQDNKKKDKGKQDTDNRVKEAITINLKEGKAVSIWTAQPKAKLTLGDKTEIQVPAFKSFEDYLIKKLDPSVNRQK